ncbi:MAG: hypothetical protein ACOWWM_19195 [Desulfobacterales bacterium]
MLRDRLKLMAGAALVLNLTAVVVTIALQTTTGPGDPDVPINDCMAWFVVAQLLLLALYNACYLYCIRGLDDYQERALCINNCLQWWLIAQISIVIGFLLCIVNAVWL